MTTGKTVRKKSRGKSRGGRKMEKPPERDGVFVIGIDNLAEENARERFGHDYGSAEDRSKFVRQGLINDDATITKKGWDLLTLDARKLEDNALAWLRKTFNHVRDEGHNSQDQLIGMFWWDPSNRKQLEELDVGIRERIDFSDSSYGSFVNVAWKGISDFGANLLGGSINFERVNANEVEELLDAHTAGAKKKRKR